jgi:hypothetical protein
MSQPERRFPRHIALALKAAVERLSNTARGSFWLVPEPICRTYVLAVHDGLDPLDAIQAHWFGRAAVGTLLGRRDAVTWLRGLQAVDVEIPRAST